MERPILFNTEMVRAILEGRKTQTRRIIKRQPIWSDVFEHLCWYPKKFMEGPIFLDVEKQIQDTNPFGKPGDTLWVRETVADVNSEQGPTLLYKDGSLRFWEDFCTVFDKDYGAGPSFNYDVYPGMKNDWCVWFTDIDINGEGGRWTPSIHMPRWASRINLEINNIRVERVQDISEEDAKAEGVKPEDYNCIGDEQYIACDIQERTKSSHPHVFTFAVLWDSITKEGEKWKDNPRVWVVDFTPSEGR